MISYCLRIDEYKELVGVNCFQAKKKAELEYIQELFESCKYWDNKIVGINYFFSLALEGFQKHGVVNSSAIEFIYELRENANFEIQEVEIDFIETLFQTFNLSEITIEEKLIEVQNLIDG